MGVGCLVLGREGTAAALHQILTPILPSLGMSTPPPPPPHDLELNERVTACVPIVNPPRGLQERTRPPPGAAGAGQPHRPVPRLTTTPRSLESFLMMMAARILRPSREGWKLLVSALKHRWLSMAIWSWKVLPVRGSCGDRRPSQGPGLAAAATPEWAGRARSPAGGPSCPLADLLSPPTS